METQSVFVYGTLLEPERQQQLLNRICAMVPARIEGYRRCQGHWPYIVPHHDGRVSGTILTDLSEADLIILDGYEDVAEDACESLYVRQRLDAWLENGHIVSPWVYIPVLENWDKGWLEGNA